MTPTNKLLAALAMSLVIGNELTVNAATLPQLPQKQVDVTMPTVTGNTYTVATCADIQTHLNSAAAANVNLTHAINIPPTLSCTQNYVLPSHTGGTGWILIRTSSFANLPSEGTRASTANSSLMPILKYNFGNGDEGVFEAKTGAQRYRFIGLDIQGNAAIAPNYSLIVTGYGNFNALNTGYIIIDRCLLRDTDPNHATLRGVMMNAELGNTAIIDSYVTGIKDVGRTSDSQAVLITANPGPILIRNNFLRASGENIMTGGGGTPSSSVIPTNLTIQRNTIDKDPTWCCTLQWLQKTLLELKCSNKVLIEGNDFLNMPWDDGGNTFRLTVRGNSGSTPGGDPWCETSDITIRYNLAANVTNFINSFGSDDGGPGFESMHSKRWHIHDNLIYGLGWICGGGASCGRFYQIQGGGQGTNCTDPIPTCKNENLTIAHNTIDDVKEALFYNDASGFGGIGLDFRDNLINVNGGRGAYSMSLWGTNLLNAAWGTTWNWANNRLAGIGGGEDTGLYPQGTNSYPANITNFLWTNRAARDYTLQSSSPAKGTASDGTDQGVNFSAYNTARAGGSVGGTGGGGSADLTPPATPQNVQISIN